MTLPTLDGGTIEITRYGALADYHVRDSSGRTVATVTRRAGEGTPWRVACAVPTLPLE